jgi:LuxR family transcriptional regulator, maltose regulon positive regulatory protein
MSRALRYAPPIGERGLVVRPRLLEKLHSRFDRPLTILVAEAGCGKTTLLTQAVEENRLEPLGIDTWLTCQRDDGNLSFLADGAFNAVGLTRPVPEDPREAAIAVADAIWEKAPDHLALILDDAHEISPATAGAAFLAMLVEELPRNGHLVIAARPEFKLEVSRLRAAGRIREITQDELLFASDELSEFAKQRGVPVELLEPWPGVAELRATVGVDAVVSYLWAELLAQFPRERRRALGVLAAIGGADAALARELFGPDIDLDHVLDGLPLVVRAASGWRSLHPTWANALRHQLDAAEAAEVWRKAGLFLRRRRQYHDAMDLLLRAEAWNDVRALITEVCEVCTPLVPTDVLEVWQSRLPPELHATGEGLLLAGMIAEPTDPVVAEKVLKQALEADPVASVRYACLNALVQLAFWRADRDRMKWIVSQLHPFSEQGHPGARGWIALVNAVLEPRVSDVRAQLRDPSLLDPTTHNPVQDWLHAHVVLLKLGDPDRAESLALTALEHEVTTMEAVSRSALAESYRLRGMLNKADQLVPELVKDLKAPKVLTSPELITQVVVLLDVLGRLDESSRILEEFLPTVERSPVAWAPIAGVLAQAFHAVAMGDESRAGEALRPIVSLPVVRNEAALVQVSPAALILVYVLAPAVRERWDANEQPGCFRSMHSLARALVDLREQGSTERLATLGPFERKVMPAAMPIPWLTELAVGEVALQQEHGLELLAMMGTLARPSLRQLSGSAHHTIRKTAKKLLQDLPATPTYRLQLRVLGPMALVRDGVVETSDELRRERVRQLLGYLVMHRRMTRQAIAASLWPDLDETTAARNLRTTLAYLQRALEPHRPKEDQPYFVRSRESAPVLELVIDQGLEVDAIVFEKLLQHARRLTEQGALSEALKAYSDATELWNGDFLADVSLDDWEIDAARHRLRSQFVEAALRAGNLLLARGEIAKAAALADRAVQAEPASEEAYQLLIAVHLERGDHVGAEGLLNRCLKMLKDLELSPRPQTITLARKLARTR